MSRLFAALAAAALLALAGCGGDEAPADGAAKLVPADALVFVHASTDPERDHDKRLFGRLDDFAAVKSLLERLPQPLDLDRDVRPWLGAEAALALTDTGTPRANVLILAAVRDRPKAEGFLSRVAGARPATRWRSVLIRRFSNLSAAFVNSFLVIGAGSAVRETIDIAKGHRAALAASAVYERVAKGRPKERSLDAWVSPQGVRRVLRPLSGLGGAIGAVLDHPRLAGVGAALVEEEKGLRLKLRIARPAQPQFEPELVKRTPEDAAGYVSISGLDAPAGLLGQIETLAEKGAGLDFERDVLAPLRGEVALSVTPRLPVPVVTLVAKTRDERRTREALARLQQPLAEALGGTDGATFSQREVAGAEAFALPVRTGFELLYTVTAGRLVISTAQAGLEQAIDPDGDLTTADHFVTTVGDPPEAAEALAFVDLSELLALGEQTGLTGIPGFDAVRDDLQRIRSAGAVVRRQEPDTTAELFFEIP
jgi:hypothetical protein